jgi:nicotinamidase/pyrazinamidase
VKTVFFDIDTQYDFLYPDGALYVPGAENVVATIAALNHYAASHQIPVVSTMDAHTPDDPEFTAWPVHCVAGTAGQRKPAATLLERQTTVSTSGSLNSREFEQAQQILVEKQTFDCFSNPNLAQVLIELNAHRYVVYGVVTEICVRLATEGLLKTGKRVELVTDAVRELNETAAHQMRAAFIAAGGILTDAANVMSS